MNKRDHLRLSHSATEILTIALISLSLAGPALAENAPGQYPEATIDEDAATWRGNTSDLSAMLPFLVTSPDRERLAVQLLSAMQRGDLKEAETTLNAAIEAGTLAIALIDRIRDPDLLSSLQGLGLQAAQNSPGSPSACIAPAQSSEDNLADLQEALDREQSHSAAITRTLSDLTKQYNALTVRLETESSGANIKVSGLQHDLQQERQQREAIMQQLANLQTDYRALQTAGVTGAIAKTQEVSKLETLLQRERERGDTIERQLADAREEMRNLQALKEQEGESAIRIAELEDILSQAQVRGDDFAQRLADTAQELRSLQGTQDPNVASPTPGSARIKAETFTSLGQGDGRAPSPSVVPVKEEPAPGSVTSALPAKSPATVAITQLPEAARPLSTARIAPAAPPAAKESLPEPKASQIRPDDRLVARAEELFQKGDVSGARLLLEHALSNGHARAAFLLAETFDPHILSKLGARGIRGDVGKAREYYAQAQALGMSQASERMEALK
ncbi:hypothetical protein MHY87_09240 [Microvirga sp. ACRRW]|uniref:hypothetical protein n=1 Tax=Microvirga sp. ACRRW TaxID=2918205 RepID=UPI001EF70B3B|nr:hypothetical protein [Microvirga sp. ACRRW]MCG7393088.1 hypothetical protein [Microvirga sp. ACRRW]